MEVKETILSSPIEEEMKESYLDYAMSVIVSRAIPDVADGLKPVHRRILYSMYRQGLTPGKAFKKSASTVGDVMAKYHPHGDSSIYDAMVRMAQDFNMRYMLVEGHGNFGSVDGDPAAAMRYTEARMTHMAVELLDDIDKETIDFQPNFDNSMDEPVVLPTKFPNLLVNGSAGIAVGMATNIPPHNLGEIIDALVFIIDNPEEPEEKLLRIVKAPDFPTGAYIMGRRGAKQAFRTGKGSVTMRAVTEVVPQKNRNDIIVTEIPYQVNKARLIQQIAKLVKDKKLTGIRDIRDESDRRGMRIVIELTSNTIPNVILNNLFKHTQLQTNFNINMLALVDGVPRTLTLKQALDYYLLHRHSVIRSRSEFELRKAKARAHILEGLQIALDNIDEVIKTIRASQDGNEAKKKLIEKFQLSDKQAQAILDMRLQRLTGLERDKIEAEYAELIKQIAYLEDLLASDRKIYQVIKEELLYIRERYADPRRSRIMGSVDSFEDEDLIPVTDVFVTISHQGYVKRFPLSTYRSQRRGGKGIGSSKLKEEDFIEHTFVTTSHHYLLFFTNHARVFKLKVYEIPEMGRQARGSFIMNLIRVNRDEKITAIIPVSDFESEDSFLTMCTREGYVKKTALNEYSNILSSGILALSLDVNDELISVHQTSGDHELFIATRKGKAIRFHEDQIRPMGRVTRGVRGIKLRNDDAVISMDYIEKGTQVLMLTEKGIGKRSPVDEFPLQNRYGYGVIAARINKRTGDVVRARVIHPQDEIILTTNMGYVIRMQADEVSTMSRATQGVIIIRLDEEDSVTGFSIIPYDEEEEEETE
ncbi:MAG: DNA gyrase subunit A [Vulcanimicrobiota bacterium]